MGGDQVAPSKCFHRGRAVLDPMACIWCGAIVPTPNRRIRAGTTDELRIRLGRRISRVALFLHTLHGLRGNFVVRLLARMFVALWAMLFLFATYASRKQ